MQMIYVYYNGQTAGISHGKPITPVGYSSKAFSCHVEAARFYVEQMAGASFAATVEQSRPAPERQLAINPEITSKLLATLKRKGPVSHDYLCYSVDGFSTTETANAIYALIEGGHIGCAKGSSDGLLCIVSKANGKKVAQTKTATEVTEKILSVLSKHRESFRRGTAPKQWMSRGILINKVGKECPELVASCLDTLVHNGSIDKSGSINPTNHKVVHGHSLLVPIY